MEPQLFAVVSAADHDQVVCLGIETGDGAMTFRRDPNTQRSEFGSWQSMNSAYAFASKAMAKYGELDLIVFESTVDEILRPDGKICATCDNQRMIPAATDDEDIACPDCAR